MENCEEFVGFLPFQQSAPYAAAMQAFGARIRWVDGQGRPVLMLERGRLRLISRVRIEGQGAASADRREALRRLARWPGLTIATPETEVRGVGLVPLVSAAHHAIWALGPDLRAGLTGKWRNRLGAAERTGVEPRPGNRATLARLIAAEASQRRQRGYRGLPPAFVEALPPSSLRLWEWRHAGEMAAAMCFVVHDGSATYQLGWGDAAARQAGVHALMLTRAAEALRAEGLRWLDLGLVDTERAPGLARFKLGTGARLHRLGATALVLP
ncbi:GNAT family N-acetyltransferase [Rhodobacter calidifons]|uniref:GNAT family N-acetyltransferase n=1 Tax=Rhodobacter calidifons TaxID=2715277 RepID=A0ABX0G8S7_9RHOB|nr:GNAT family N-acetyltransferase [Rhodobacter calidifons]NHB77280.1 GNAT family N-acetyltransferase [Rhodobacter calidifons]